MVHNLRNHVLVQKPQNGTIRCIFGSGRGLSDSFRTRVESFVDPLRPGPVCGEQTRVAMISTRIIFMIRAVGKDILMISICSDILQSVVMSAIFSIYLSTVYGNQKFMCGANNRKSSDNTCFQSFHRADCLSFSQLVQYYADSRAINIILAK